VADQEFSGADAPATRRRVLLLIAVSALLRLAVTAALGLSVDEAYSVAISRRFALSYFDHPPLHVWLVGAWARLLGSEDPLLLRLPDIALFAGSTWLLYRLTATLYGARAGLWAALVLNLTPLFTLNVAGGIVPDGPLVLFALLAVFCFMRAVLTPTPPAGALWWMLAAGAAAGLALLSKYLAIFPIVALGFYLLTCQPRWLARPAPWLAALVVVVFFTPVLIWNHSHEWISFAFQGGRIRATGFSLKRAALDLAGQLLYLLPWIALGLLYALARALRRGPRGAAGWLFVSLATGPIVLFSFAALWTPVLPHWPAIGWLFAIPLLATQLAGLETERPRLLFWSASATAAFLLCLVSLAATQAATGWLVRFVPALADDDPTLDFLDWRDLAPEVAKLQRRDPDLLVATVSWIDAGKADYVLGGTVPVLCLSADPRQFAFMHDEKLLRGRDALIVTAAGRPDWLRLAEPHFRHIEPGEDVSIRRAGLTALILHTAHGYGLR